MLSEVQREQWGVPGVVDSDRTVPVTTAVWGRGQTLGLSHYLVRATYRQRRQETLERVGSL
jgi:hypothetical protein